MSARFAFVLPPATMFSNGAKSPVMIYPFVPPNSSINLVKKYLLIYILLPLSVLEMVNTMVILLPSWEGQTVNKNQAHWGQCYEDDRSDGLGEAGRNGWIREPSLSR